MISKASNLKSQVPNGGYTLIELIVAVGLFAIIMVLASGAYLVMIGVNRQTQAITTGIDNLAFVLESMTRSIRTGSNYNHAGTSTFWFVDQYGCSITYGTLDGRIVQTESGAGCPTLSNAPLTAPSVNISSLAFNVSGGGAGDAYQPYVTIRVSGTVSSGPGKTEPFNVETSATMRGTDL